MIWGLNEQLTGIVKLKIKRTAFDKLLIRGFIYLRTFGCLSKWTNFNLQNKNTQEFTSSCEHSLHELCILCHRM